MVDRVVQLPCNAMSVFNKDRSRGRDDYFIFYFYHQKTDGNKAKQQSREHRAIQRRLQSAVCNEEFGDLLKFNQLMVRKSICSHYLFIF